MNRTFLTRRYWLLPLLTVFSLLINLLQLPFIYGTFGALVVAVLTQVYLPGHLLARRIGRHRLPNPIHRFGWVLACGLSLSIVLGGPFRLFEQSIPTYLVALHSIMLILAFWPEGATPADEPSWNWSWKLAPLYGIVALCCAIVMGISYESRYRFYGFEDQPIFISYIDWLAHHPGVRPVPETPLRTRQVAVISNDSRMDTDGWTYNHAAWSWVSGVSGAQIIWFDLATLFIWSVPLITFALAYELTRRDSMAAFSAAALTFVGLLTLDNLIHAPNYVAFGRYVVFQINVVRQASLTLMLPLSLLCAFAYLRSGVRRDLLSVALSALALALMHPIQYVILVLSLGAVALIRLVASPNGKTFRLLLPLVAILVFILALPYVQRSTRIADMNEDVLTVVRPNLLANTNSLANQFFTVLPELPLIGQTYIRRPATVFYHLSITLAVALGILFGLRWRSHPVKQYAFAVTLLALILFFTPGLTRLFDRIVSSVGILTAIFMLPVALVYGQATDDLFQWVRHWRFGRAVQPIAIALMAALMLVLLIEPFPIPSSARDLLDAYNAMQEPRRMHPAQAAASQRLMTQLPPGEISVIATPRDIANFMIEDSPDVLITGGRSNANRAMAANDRLFTEGTTNAPWLDSVDLAFLNQWKVTHLLALTDWTRLAQVELQPERFIPLGTVQGYIIYRVEGALIADETDTRFTRMNELYETQTTPRWGREGFSLSLPPANQWQSFIAEWEAALNQNPSDNRARLGLAYAQTLAGDDYNALQTWTSLMEEYPAVPLYTEAVAAMRARVEQTDVNDPLLKALESPFDYIRVLAARLLLTENYFYRLSDEALDRVLTVTETDAITWDRLAMFDQPDAVRARATLMLYRGKWDKAVQWLRSIPRIRLAPQDLEAIAAAQLANNDLDAALDTLRPGTNPDWVRPNATLHPDRWATNTVVDLYNQLEMGRFMPVESLPDTHPLRLLGVPSIYAFDAVIRQASDDQYVTITATFGDFRARDAFPIETWRVYLISEDGLTEYVRKDIPATLQQGPLVRVSIDIETPSDVPPLTPVQVIVEPRYNNAVTANPLRQFIVLNRPEPATLATGVLPDAARFGEQIYLRGNRVHIGDGIVQVDLYWFADVVPTEDYQVFIHVFDMSGNRVAQRDSGPVNGRYPTSQWLPGILILDQHQVQLDQALPPGQYTVRIGLYRLSDGTRLPIAGAAERTQSASLQISTFSPSESHR